MGFEETLLESVISKNKCTGCGACVTICPFNVLDYHEKPELVNECKTCGICAKVCPRYDYSQPEMEKMEKMIFGRERKENEEFGVYQKILVAQSTDKKILSVCQDGGVATSLLVCAMQNGLIDAAVATGVNQETPLMPYPKVAEDVEEILECAGTKYVYSPNLLALKDAIGKGKKRIAVVGTPCQIHAIRKIQAAKLKKYSDPVKFTIGLMCTESFDYNCLIGHVRKLGVEPEDVKKMNIKGKLLIFLKSGEIKRIPLSELKGCMREGCKSCDDFSSELSDISVGGLGLSGWTFTIIRTPKGEELFEAAEKAGLITSRKVESNEPALQLLVKLSKIKRKRADYK